MAVIAVSRRWPGNRFGAPVSWSLPPGIRHRQGLIALDILQGRIVIGVFGWVAGVTFVGNSLVQGFYVGHWVAISCLKRRGAVQIALMTIEGDLQAATAENYKQQDAQKEDMSKRVIAHLDTLVLQSAQHRQNRLNSTWRHGSASGMPVFRSALSNCANAQ